MPIAGALRLDHGAIAALLVPTPRPDIVGHSRTILERYNAREEEPGGLYDECDRALGSEASLRFVEELRTYPPIRLKPYNDGAAVEAHIRQAMDRSRKAW